MTWKRNVCVSADVIRYRAGCSEQVLVEQAIRNLR